MQKTAIFMKKTEGMEDKAHKQNKSQNIWTEVIDIRSCDGIAGKGISMRHTKAGRLCKRDPQVAPLRKN